MARKLCKQCQKLKPVSDFSRDSAMADGIRFRCKECDRTACRSYHARRRGEEQARNKAWREANLPRIRQRKQKKRAERLQWVVYQLNFSDGCFYIGSTKDLYGRLSLHRWEMRHGLHRNGNIRAAGYTSDDFTVKVINQASSEEEARRGEGQMIEAHFHNPVCLNQQRVFYTEA